MYFISKKKTFILLFITALTCTRGMFVFFNDPEGPNLLIVVVMGAGVFALSLTPYLFKISEVKKMALAVVMQVCIVAIFCVYNNVGSHTNLGVGLTEEQAVLLVKKAYPLYQEYPSDNLPIKRVEAVPFKEGWRVGMYIEGSGVQGILKANCFLVNTAREVTETGLFQGEGPAKSINLITCTPKE